jgi:hypothetical protein
MLISNVMGPSEVVETLGGKQLKWFSGFIMPQGQASTSFLAVSYMGKINIAMTCDSKINNGNPGELIEILDSEIKKALSSSS